ncbi:MAG TPA: glycosyltransferase family 4 protein [Clostridia bacterium]|nr:glycosyltransferase family 4 protein [Clostridia bacterium]
MALEGMSCGKPVLIAGESGIAGPVLESTWKKLAEHNFTARSGGQPLEAGRLASSIKETLGLLEDVDVKKKTSDFLRTLVVNEFSVKKMTDRIEGLYAQCVSIDRDTR